MRYLLVAMTIAIAFIGVGHSSAMAASGGNSAAAQACQQGGYVYLFRSDITAFKNTGDCVSYAAQGGAFATGMIIPAGHTATLSSGFLTGCDPLTAYYVLSNGSSVFLGNGGGCSYSALGTVTIGPFTSPQVLGFQLVDHYCGYVVYSSDGNHAVVTGNNPYTVRITDSGLSCSNPYGARIPQPGDTGNMGITVQIH